MTRHSPDPFGSIAEVNRQMVLTSTVEDTIARCHKILHMPYSREWKTEMMLSFLTEASEKVARLRGGSHA